MNGGNISFGSVAGIGDEPNRVRRAPT